MKSAVVVFPGSNREGDVMRALKSAGSQVEKVWHAEPALPDGTDLVVLPGGFSYGDYLRCGAIAGRAEVLDAVILMRNANLKFICHRQFLRVERTDTAFTKAYAEGQAVDVCVAHGEGNYTADAETLKRLEGEGLVAFRYCDARGHVTPDANRNGSMNSIAGIYSDKLNVLGMMPHPENLIEDLVGGTDGRGLFESLVSSFARAA
jgi:phosphoribosylformylglycinamidine synthase